jgi:hypothetical protein
MKLPKRIAQHKAESDSYAILVYKLREIGIFRNVTASDYGIDFEIELVDGENVTGRYFKAQVKSSEKLNIRKKDNNTVVGGIKESTLYYWTELSYRSHVILYAVDLSNERIFLSKPIFWQATMLINGDEKSKSVEFVKDIGTVLDKITPKLSQYYALSPAVPDEIYCHKLALRYLGRFLSLYGDAFHYDFQCELNDLDSFKALLDISKTLLWGEEFKGVDLGSHDRRNLHSFEYWVRQSGPDFINEVTNLSAQAPLKILLPKLIERLIAMRKRVFRGKYYWMHKDRQYLRLVFETCLPSDTKHDTLWDWGGDFNKHQYQAIDFSVFQHYQQKDLIQHGLL